MSQESEIFFYVYVNPHHRSKMHHRCFRRWFIGYGEQNGLKAYEIFKPQTGKTIYSRFVKFDELSVLQRNGDTITNEDGEDPRCLPHLVETEHNNIYSKASSRIISLDDAAKESPSQLSRTEVYQDSNS